jgi:hypothetical protein
MGKWSLRNSMDRAVNERRAMNRCNPEPKKALETFIWSYAKGQEPSKKANS